MALIELGTVGAETPAPRSPRPELLTRRALAVAVVVLCLLGLSASERPGPGILRPLWQTSFGEGDNFDVTGDLVIVQRLGTKLAAYDLVSGREVWHRDLGAAGSWAPVAPGGVLLMPTGMYEVTTSDQSIAYFARTVGIDATTGRDRWETAGEPTLFAADSVLFEERNSTGQSRRIKRVRTADGAVLWSRPSTGVTGWIGLGPDDQHFDRVVTVDNAGQVTVVRYADGQTLVSGKIPWRPPNADGSPSVSMTGYGDTIAVEEWGADTVTIKAYSADTLAPTWSSGTPNRGGGAYCQRIYCLTDAQQTLRVLDWATGALRWSRPGVIGAYQPAPGLVLANQADESNLLLDENTGRVLATLGRGDALSDSDSGELITVRPDGAGTHIVSWLDRATGRVWPLGHVGASGDWGCRYTKRILICAGAGQGVAASAIAFPS
jgi:hypothetical protein